MILVTHRWDVAPGRMAEALEWRGKLHSANEKAGTLGPKWWFLRPVTGDLNRIVAVNQWASMAEFEEATNKRSTNPEIAALIKEAGKAGWLLRAERSISRVEEES